MSKTVFDMGLIALQLFTVGAGLILIGCLSAKIAKNRRQQNRSPSRSDASFSETLVTQLVEQQFQKALVQAPASIKRNNIPPVDSLRAENDRVITRPPTAAGVVKRGALPRAKGNGNPLEIRYRQAAHLASRGVEPGIIQRRVELPRCEIDLITKLSCQYRQFDWETHRTLVEAIEAGG